MYEHNYYMGGVRIRNCVMAEPDLTAADRVELESAHKSREYGADGEVTPGVNRWTEYGNDRLYFNELWESTYVDLETGRVHSDASAVSGSSEVDGDTLTVELRCRDVTITLAFSLKGEAFDSAEDDDADDAAADGELVADGGVDTREVVSDEMIEAAIQSNDTPDSDESFTAAEIRRFLDDMQADFERDIGEFRDLIDDGAFEIVYETPAVLVLADTNNLFYADEVERIAREVADLSDRDMEILHSIISHVHHAAADDYVTRSFATSDPVVFTKSRGFRAGEWSTLDEIARRTEETGSVARAVDQLVTEVHGFSKTYWADRSGRNKSTVSRTTRPKQD